MKEIDRITIGRNSLLTLQILEACRKQAIKKRARHLRYGWIKEFIPCWKRQWKTARSNSEYVRKTPLVEQIRETVKFAYHYSRL
jgi:hypothetical protein